MMKENIEVGKRESTRNDIAHDKIHHKIKHYLYRYFITLCNFVLLAELLTCNLINIKQLKCEYCMFSPMNPVLHKIRNV
jgi:hypothetical protein